MLSNRDNILTTFLNCGEADLSLLDDIWYDWDDILTECRDCYGVYDINYIIGTVFRIGLREMTQDIGDRMRELGEIRSDRKLDQDEIKELRALTSLNPEEDFESYHNYLDTHIWCNQNGEIYQDYLPEAIEKFEHNTGFSISFNS